ncbi:hypothetical protein HYT55_04665 [Candidatus Woesearchaeota archaeon]|nr:hypothetical protein [Candidatus Woesearchaeota archaeon]
MSDDYNQKTGLDGDYITVWVRVGVIHGMHDIRAISEEDFVAKIAQPVEKYFEYLGRKYPWQVEEARRRANPFAYAKLDELIDSYNDLPLEERKRKETGETYRTLCQKIINGEE